MKHKLLNQSVNFHSATSETKLVLLTKHVLVSLMYDTIVIRGLKQPQ
jgi:hypothetical protein